MLSCSAACRDEPIGGSTTGADFWVALEQRGPWGKKALSQSRLDPELGLALEAACKARRGRALLIRPVGDKVHVDDAPRTVLVAGGPAEEPWLLSGTIDDPRRVLDLPFDALSGPAPDVSWLAPADPVALICTNAKRDQCCALLGLPLASELARRRPGRVWECSHTGGHRFAPTGLVLPTRQLLGRMTTFVVGQALDAAARGEVLVDLAHDRGRGHLGDPMLEVAESALRAYTGWGSLRGVTVVPHGERAAVGTVGSERFLVRLDRVALPPAPASCVAQPQAREAWAVVGIEPFA